MVWRLLIGLAAGLATGIALAVFLVFGPMELGGVRNGPWQTNLHIGSSEANPLLRAIVARRGLLALNRSETVYFTAWEDGDGAPLDAACTYRLEGGSLPTRWWSLTLYGEDNFLARNGDNAHAATLTDLDPQSWTVIAGPEPQADTPWLSTHNAGRFSITLRLYHPEPQVLETPDTVTLPQLTRLHCGAGS